MPPLESMPFAAQINDEKSFARISFLISLLMTVAALERAYISGEVV